MRDNMPYENLSLLQRLNEYGVFGYLWLLAIAFWGGTTRYLMGLKGKKPTLFAWLSETVISGFVGVITAMVCQYYDIDFLITSAATGIAAHNGTRSLYVITEFLKKNMASSSISEEQLEAPSKLNKKGK